MKPIHSFQPIARPDATRLVLGTAPGIASLAARQYYAHPRNAFWPIFEAMLGLPASLPYAERCLQVVTHHVAVWDVLHSCTRSGSLDSAIDEVSIVPNDFPGFFAQHPGIELICFNGMAAETIWRRHIARNLPPLLAAVPTLRLPSTSPAHAGMPLTEKIARWRQVLNNQ